MPFCNYFAIIAIVLAIGQISHVACIVEYFREGFDREGFQDSLSDDEAVKLGLVRSEEGVVVGPEDYLFYEEDDDGERRRARRSVDQTQRDAILKTLNDIRRSVNSSDIQYMYWNSADEPMLSTWASQCQYSAKVYLTATARVIKMVSDKPSDFVAQLYDSLRLPDIQRMLTSVFIKKVSANSYFCPKLVTNSTTTFNNSYLGIISLTYVTGFKLNTTQFTVGPPCTTCLSGVYWCDDKLCRVDCSPAIPTCYCRPACLNCAGYNETTCKCNCLSGWGGARCEYNTTSTPTVPNCTTIAPSTYPSTATTEASPSTTTSYLNESVTTENATIDTANGGGNETTASFFDENMTTNETANDTTPVFPIDETTSTLFNDTEESKSTTASPIDNIFDTSATSVPIQSTTVNNPDDFNNYTQRFFGIENFVLRLLLMLQYFFTGTTTATTTATQTSVLGNDSSGTTPLFADNF